MLNVQFWGISATIGNLQEASDVLLASLNLPSPDQFASSKSKGCAMVASPFGGSWKGAGVMVKAEMKKQIEVESVFPDEIETYPWDRSSWN